MFMQDFIIKSNYKKATYNEFWDVVHKMKKGFVFNEFLKDDTGFFTYFSDSVSHANATEVPAYEIDYWSQTGKENEYFVLNK